MSSIKILEEPLLEFYQGKHIDVRFGLAKYGTFDREPRDKKRIKIGIVGTDRTINDLKDWLEKIKSPVKSVEENKILHPSFPGLGINDELNLTLLVDQKFEKIVDPIELQKITKIESHDKAAGKAAELFLQALRSSLAKTSVDLILCCPPFELYQKLRIETPKDNKGEKLAVDFHDLLKAKALEFNIPIQFIWPWTYTDEVNPPKESGLKLQNAATIAWNFYIAIYYKASGIPWRMIRDSKDSTTCYVGISFYSNIDKSKLLSSIAQVFNEKGEGIIMRGEPVKIDKDDKHINLSEENAFKLLDNALKSYKEEHYNFPARVVLHKTSFFNDAEIQGFKRVLDKYFIQLFDFMSLRKDFTRLYREGYYPPLRGSFLKLDLENAILYTRGSINFYKEYPGMYVPRPLHIRFAEIQSSHEKLATEILELSKMNYNNSQFSESLPITVRTSKNVSSIIRYVGESGYLPPSYRFYM